MRPNGTLAEESIYVHGKRHGPHRRYDDSGTIIFVESMYSDGKLVSESVTLAGLGAIVAYANEQEKKKGSEWRMSVIDLNHLRYTTKVGFFDSLLLGSQKQLRQEISREMCPLMAVRGTDIRSVYVTYLDGNGDLEQEFTIRREECVAGKKTP